MASDSPPATVPRRRLFVNEWVEARPSKCGSNGLFARKLIQAGTICCRDHPVCLSSREGDIARQLPQLDNLDGLMQALVENAAQGDDWCKRALKGEWQMTYVQRHLDVQETTDDDLPVWCKKVRMAPEEYNLLAAQLQSNVAGHVMEHGNQGLILNPRIRLCNHDCDPNTHLAWREHMGSNIHAATNHVGEESKTKCTCGAGDYLLIAQRDIAADEEITFSYMGDQMRAADDVERRQEVIERRWGFRCKCDFCEDQLKITVSKRRKTS
eukprot:scaffold166833_cov34-Tisochrysis_lutea.AAC.1